MLNGRITIAEGFQSSINIAFDLHNTGKVKSFIPTHSALDVIEDVMLSTTPTSKQRSRILVGAYGRGKSHLVLVLASLLYHKDKSLFEPLLSMLEKSRPQLHEFIMGFLDSSVRLLPVIIGGSSTSLTQSFLYALQQALKSEGLSDLMPETHFKASVNTIMGWRSNYRKTYQEFVEHLQEPVDSFLLSLQEFNVAAYEKFVSLYPELTSGSTFNPFVGFDVVEIYEGVVDSLKGRGFDGIYVIYDEFSKYLESSITNATISDIKLLQDFAEKCDRSGSKQMHLMLISHKDISNYIDGSLPKDKVDGWRGVSGRFKHISLRNGFDQMYEVIAAVINKDPQFWDCFSSLHKDRFEAMERVAVTRNLFSPNSRHMLELVVKGCYPLHPISTFILPRLSERVAQNERTLFTFLASPDKNSLATFLSSDDSEFPMVTPDFLYDYFEPLLRKEPYTSDAHKIYRLTSTLLAKVGPDSLDSRIIKTIALIYVVQHFEELPPTYDVLVEAFRNSVDPRVVGESLSRLIEKECLVYLKRSNNHLKLKESSGVDITAEIHRAANRIGGLLSAKDILNDLLPDNYLYPTRYNDRYEITRWFSLKFIDSTEFYAVKDWEARVRSSGADGIVYGILPTSGEEIETIRESLGSGKHNHDRIVFVLPKQYRDIRRLVLEYKAMMELSAETGEDEILADEYDIYIEDLEEVIASFISAYTRPENGAADYFYNGEQQYVSRKAELSLLLSGICERAFPYTPIINNESINKNVLPSVAISSRSKVLSGLLRTTLEPNLGLAGTGQDVSIMRSTLIRTGILRDADTEPFLNIEPTDDNLRNMLSVMQDFLVSTRTRGEQRFSDLYDILTSPKHGLGMKLGVIPIYLAVILHVNMKGLVIKCRGLEEKITPALLNSINENPEDYSVSLEEWTPAVADYVAALESVFIDYVSDNEKARAGLSYLVLAMRRWFVSLPKYCKELRATYLGSEADPTFCPLPDEVIHFLGSLRRIENNPTDYLLDRLVSIFNLERFDPRLPELVRETRTTLDSAITDLLSVVSDDVIRVFAGNGAAGRTLYSTMKDWYEGLDKSVSSYLFSGNQNHILRIIEGITNDEDAFLRELCRAITSLRVDDWSEDTISTFLEELRAFKTTVEQYDNDKKQGSLPSYNTYRIVFTDTNGDETVRTFHKAAYSDRARLLLNDILTSLEEMGQSISMQEKRQVLIEVLEKLC